MEGAQWRTDLSQFQDDIEDELVVNQSKRKKFTRLECISGAEISLLLYVMHVVYLIAMLIAVVDGWLGYTIWREVRKPHSFGSEIPRDDRPEPPLRQVLRPYLYEAILGLVSYGLLLYTLVLLVYFVYRLSRIPSRDRLHEQMYVVMLLTGITIYLSPLKTIHKVVFRSLGGTIVPPSLDVLRNESFGLVTIVYLWCNIHVYRVLGSGIPPLFYVPKIFLVLLTFSIYNLLQPIFLLVAIEALPFVNLINLLSRIPVVRYYQAAGITALTLLELAIVVWIIRDIVVTTRVLRQVNYMNFRSKQVGFRFFLYHNVGFYMTFWLVAIAEKIINPDRPGNSLASRILLAEYISVEVFTKLPCNNYRATESEAEEDQDDGAPLKYRAMEDKSKTQADNSAVPNCFTMQTVISLFNFSWYVYYLNTKKVETLFPSQDVFKFKISREVVDTETDTQIMVVDGEDRIVVAFRGSVSKKNLQTDLKIQFESLSLVTPSSSAELGNCNYRSIFHSRLFRAAYIHSGFATAYSKIAEDLLSTIQHLYQEKPRAIFLTGHSLGGALASLCSLDLALSFGLRDKDIHVVTFGSPRVGNRAFRDIHNSVIGENWRIALGPDPVARLPKVGYSHSGRKVLLSSDGNLFLDPSSLELRIGTGDSVYMSYHRKASYMLALRAWCENHHGESYIPEFWPWPISREDSRRFSHVIAAGTLASIRSACSNKTDGQSHGPQSKLTDRLRMADQITDATPTERWISVTARLLALSDSEFD